MIIRLATIDDIPEMVKLHQMFVQSSPLLATFGDADVAETAAYVAAMTGESGFALVAELPEARGTLVGILAVEVMRMPMFPTLLAQDLFTYVHPSYRGTWLRKAFSSALAEARKRGCAQFFFHCIGSTPEHNSKNTAFLESQGCEPLGQTLTKKL